VAFVGCLFHIYKMPRESLFLSQVEFVLSGWGRKERGHRVTTLDEYVCQIPGSEFIVCV